MNTAVHKQVVLGLIFLKYISDAFQEKHDALAGTRNTEYTDLLEECDEYPAASVFSVPKKARSSAQRVLRLPRAPTRPTSKSPNG